MSTIVKTEQGDIILYCKGADSIIFDRLANNITEFYLVFF